MTLPMRIQLIGIGFSSDEVDVELTEVVDKAVVLPLDVLKYKVEQV